MNWQPIETAPENETCLFWIIPRPPEECWCNTSGEPIYSWSKPEVRMTRKECWSALDKATHWMPLPGAPNVWDDVAYATGQIVAFERRKTDLLIAELRANDPVYKIPLSCLTPAFSPHTMTPVDTPLHNPTPAGDLHIPCPDNMKYYYLHALEILLPGDQRRTWFCGWRRIPESLVGLRVGKRNCRRPYPQP